jgi:hypothetical protein
MRRDSKFYQKREKNACVVKYLAVYESLYNFACQYIIFKGNIHLKWKHSLYISYYVTYFLSITMEQWLEHQSHEIFSHNVGSILAEAKLFIN